MEERTVGEWGVEERTVGEWGVEERIVGECDWGVWARDEGVGNCGIGEGKEGK